MSNFNHPTKQQIQDPSIKRREQKKAPENLKEQGAQGNRTQNTLNQGRQQDR